MFQRFPIAILSTVNIRKSIDTRWLRERAYELCIDELGVCHAEPYERAKASILARKQRGKFADLRFTMARTSISCHPEKLIDGAMSVISAALCYWAPEHFPAGEMPFGRIARYTRSDAYDALIQRLDLIALDLQNAGFQARVLVDSNEHVDREAAIRSGVGFSGKHTNIITRKLGSWVVLGTLVTDAMLEATLPLRVGCGSCTLCLDACPTGALVDVIGGELDATRCISYWTQSRHSIPSEIRESMQDMVYGCDICQEVCPWNRAVEKRRVDASSEPFGISLVEWLEGSDQSIDDVWQRLFVPRRQIRYLRRNALIALGNSGDETNAALAAPYLDSDDAMLREHAAWALRKLGGSLAAAALHRAGV